MHQMKKARQERENQYEKFIAFVKLKLDINIARTKLRSLLPNGLWGKWFIIGKL